MQKTRLGVKNISSPFYRVRALSEDGRRLFYVAPSSLATPEGDGVYEYEQDGEGTCETVSGCHSILSGVKASEADYFLGASASGNDVYFATSSQLSSTDRDNLRDIYDARVNGGFSSPPEIPLCERECQGPRTAPTDTPLPTDSVGISGNVPVVTPRKVCKKGFKLSHGKCVRTNAKKRKQAHKKRTQPHPRSRRGR